ncbi:hypothetical protein PAXRUDRAFT_176038, partial [Paxillus rubicundulus Ve08.2h10]
SSDGKLRHDHYDSLDDGPAVKKVCPDWDKEPIGSTWETYLKNTFNATKQVSSPTVADPKQKFELRKAEDGHWDLPPDNFLSASLELQKQLMRDFMNHCWQEMARQKGSAPFSKMTKDLAEFIDLDTSYLPDKPSLEIKDPSHMSKDNVESILQHWKERQENQFLWPIFTFKDTAKQSRKTTEHTSSNITQVTPCNVTPAIPPLNDSPKSAAVLSQQSKAGEPSPNVKPTANISTPIASSFSQTEHNHGSIDDSSSESSSDSDESENTVELWQCPNQHGATVEGQVKFLRSLGDQNKYLGLINVLHLTQVRTGSVEDALPGGLDWKYDNFHLPPEGHKWLPKHESAFGGMLIRDAEMVVGGHTPLCGYPFIPPELKGKTIPCHYISGYILPWCKRLSKQLKESNAEVISCQPHRSPADVKGKWHEARNFMLGLSSDKQYRQLVMSLEQIDNSHSPDQDCAHRIPLLDFSWDTNSHHTRDVPHKSWAMAFKAITSVTLHDSAGERYGRWYIALHAAFVGMILRNIAMLKSTLAMCAYPSLPSFITSTCITDSCVADAIQWCKTLRCTILKGSQHKLTAQKWPKPLADLPAAKKPRQDTTQEPDTKAEEDGSLRLSHQ